MEPRRRGRTSPGARGAVARARLALALVLAALPGRADAPASHEVPAQVEPGVAHPVPAEPPPKGGDEGASSPVPPAPEGRPQRAAPRPKRRGGVNPCNTPDPGYGHYAPWDRGVSMGQLLVPRRGGVTKSGRFDVVIHFHGHEPVRKEVVKVGSGVVLVGIDLGIGSGPYENAFASPDVFPRLLASIEEAVAKKRKRKSARVRHVALSAWSAGYGAVAAILRQPRAREKIDAVVLLDALHAGYEDERARTLKSVQLEPFVRFAREAAAKRTFMFVSHSSITPPGYGSTEETASFLVRSLGGSMRRAGREDVLGLDLFRRFDRGDLHVRGYRGEDKPDHCAHLGLLADVLKVHLVPRWKTPEGRP